MKLSINNLNIGPYTKRHQSKHFTNKYTLHHEEYNNLYGNFNQIVNLKDKKLLDFGGSFGNLIISSNGEINPKNYVCVDVDSNSLAKGQQMFPDAKWILCDHYNPMYNPNGKEIFSCDQKFDVIIAYSVFTHDTYYSFLSLMNKFKNMLLPNGKIFATILLSDQPYINYLREKRSKLYGTCDAIDQTKNINYLVNNKCVHEIPERFECDFLLTIYKKSFIQHFGKIHITGMYQEAVLDVDISVV